MSRRGRVISLDKKLRRRGLSEATVANYLKPARGMFEFAVLQGYIPVSPFALVPRGRLSSCNKTREHREWTTAEVLRFIATRYELDKRPDARAEYGLSVEMKVRTGARLGELLGARYGDIDFEHGIWHIRTQVHEGREAGGLREDEEEHSPRPARPRTREEDRGPQ